MPSANFAPNNVWASNTPTEAREELTLPSGQTCLAKKVGIEGLLEIGILEQIDSLTGMVEKYAKEVKSHGPSGPSKAEIDQNKFFGDTEALKAVIGLADRALPVIVVSPKVKLHYTEITVGKTKVTKMIPPDEREAGIVYTDQVGFEDKMFLFDWASGGLKSFLGAGDEPTPNVGGVVARKQPAKSTKRRPRSS